MLYTRTEVERVRAMECDRLLHRLLFASPRWVWCMLGEIATGGRAPVLRAVVSAMTVRGFRCAVFRFLV